MLVKSVPGKRGMILKCDFSYQNRGLIALCSQQPGSVMLTALCYMLHTVYNVNAYVRLGFTGAILSVTGM